jgi:hypothetical protein
MKTKIYLIVTAAFSTLLSLKGSAQSANTSLSNLLAPSKVNISLLPDNDNKRNLGSAAKSWKDIYLDGSIYLGGARFLAYQTSQQNTAVGAAVLNSNTFGTSNTGTGFNALFFNTVGGYNTANGYLSLYNNNTGNFNTATGTQSLTTNTDGSYNTAFGNVALYFNLTGNDNTAIGAAALKSNQTGDKNTSIGRAALYNNTIGNDNTATGTNALYNNQTGYSNTAMGANALYANASGHNLVAIGDSALFNQTTNPDGYYFNTAVGSKALYQNSTGYENTSVGSKALYQNSTGFDNTATGKEALVSNSAGQYNSAYGVDALYKNTNGEGNTALGMDAMFFNTSGSDNVAIGIGAGQNVTTGSWNTFLNGNCGSSGTLNYATAIGEQSVVTQSNHIVIGASFNTSIGGYANWTNFSDGRYKKNIKQNVPGLAFINKLTPITYTLDINGIETKLHAGQKERKDANGKTLPNAMETPVMKQAINEKSKIIYTGFVAQDVERTAQSLNYNFSGVDKPQNDEGFYGLRYSDFVVPLVKAVQELSSENDELKSEIENLKSEMNELKKTIKGNQQQTANVSSASLQQNIPNPFNQTTLINYSLPGQYSSAKIIVTDNLGKGLREINLYGNKKGSVRIDAATLSSGAYQYSLIVDGKLMDTKQMIKQTKNFL